MDLEPIADDVFHIPMMLRNGMNAYVLGDVLVDAGGPPFGARILQLLRAEKHSISTHVLTHAHGDHAGGSHAIVDELRIPVWIGEADAEACESGRPVTRSNPFSRTIIGGLGKFKGVRVARKLREGDTVGPGFVVVDVPGHSPGHIALWRESDRVLIAGDVWFNMNMFTTRAGLRQPLGALTPDAATNRESERKLAALEPDIVGFGHGPVLTDAAPKLAAWVGKKLK